MCFQYLQFLINRVGAIIVRVGISMGLYPVTGSIVNNPARQVPVQFKGDRLPDRTPPKDSGRPSSSSYSAPEPNNALEAVEAAAAAQRAAQKAARSAAKAAQAAEQAAQAAQAAEEFSRR
jgi:ABC-type glycerol-3-phosphate transport system substrate-binding protein